MSGLSDILFDIKHWAKADAALRENAVGSGGANRVGEIDEAVFEHGENHWIVEITNVVPELDRVLLTSETIRPIIRSTGLNRRRYILLYGAAFNTRTWTEMVEAFLKELTSGTRYHRVIVAQPGSNVFTNILEQMIAWGFGRPDKLGLDLTVVESVEFRHDPHAVPPNWHITIRNLSPEQEEELDMIIAAVEE